MANQYCNETVNGGKLNVICRSCKLNHLCLLKIIYEQDSQLFEHLIKNKMPLKKGNSLIHKGNNFKALFMVFSGSLKSYDTLLSGKEQITGIYWPGGLIGLDAIHSKHYSQSVKALENSTIIELSYSKISSIYADNPAIQSKLFELMTQEMNRSQEITGILRTKSAEARFAAYLLGISERVEHLGQSADTFILNMSRTDISNYLQMAIETISRVSTQFQRDKLIVVKKNQITLINKEKLQKLAGTVTPKYATNRLLG